MVFKLASRQYPAHERKKKCKGVNYYPDIDECAFAQLDYCEIIDLEQMLCYCIGYFNKSTLVLWHQPQCLSSWADVSGCCVLTVMNSVDRDTQHGALMRLIIKYDLLLKKNNFWMFREIVRVKVNLIGMTKKKKQQTVKVMQMSFCQR